MTFNESPLKPIESKTSTHSMIEDTVKIVNMGRSMMNDDGVVSGSGSASTEASTKDSAIKIMERRYCYSLFWKQQSVSRRTMSTQSSSRSSLYSTTSQCNNEKRSSSETFKLQLTEAIMHKLHDLGRKVSRSEDKKKKKKKKQASKDNSNSNSNSNSYERMIAELEQEGTEGKTPFGVRPNAGSTSNDDRPSPQNSIRNKAATPSFDSSSTTSKQSFGTNSNNAGVVGGGNQSTPKKSSGRNQQNENDSNSYERMIAELEQKKAARAKMKSEVLQLRMNRRRQDPPKKERIVSSATIVSEEEI